MKLNEMLATFFMLNREYWAVIKDHFKPVKARWVTKVFGLSQLLNLPTVILMGLRFMLGCLWDETKGLLLHLVMVAGTAFVTIPLILLSYLAQIVSTVIAWPMSWFGYTSMTMHKANLRSAVSTSLAKAGFDEESQL